MIDAKSATGDGTQKLVFLSHSSKDKPIVGKVQELVEAAGFATWLDAVDIRPGELIREEIEDGIRRADYFMIFFSQASVDSFWVSREIDIAVAAANKSYLPMLPVKLDDVKIPLFFSGYLYFDLSKDTHIGLRAIAEFFREESAVATEGQPITIRKADSPIEDCARKLQRISLGELRRLMKQVFDLNEIREYWFDLLETKIEDEIPNAPLGNVLVELLHRLKRKKLIDRLIRLLCENDHAIINPQG